MSLAPAASSFRNVDLQAYMKTHHLHLARHGVCGVEQQWVIGGQKNSWWAGDGGKVVCMGEGGLGTPKSRCRIISVGSNGDPSFEVAMHRLAPRCDTHIFDGTLNSRRRARLRNILTTLRGVSWHVEYAGSWGIPLTALHEPNPAEALASRLEEIARRPNTNGTVTFLPVNFCDYSFQFYSSNSSLHSSSTSTSTRARQHGVAAARPVIEVLKIDCEGCEFEVLPPLLKHVCVQQILMELHGCDCGHCGKPNSTLLVRSNTTAAWWRYERVHRLMQLLHHQGFRVFSVVPNTRFSDGTCSEYGLLRSSQCD